MNPAKVAWAPANSDLASQVRVRSICTLGRGNLQLLGESRQHGMPKMLFDFEKYSAKMAARQMSRQCLEEKQRDVYESHRHRVFSVSYYMTGSEIEAEELLQDTFITAFQRAPEPDQETVDTAMLDQIRERTPLEDAEAPPVPQNVYLPVGRNILRADLEEAIRCLPPTERLVFLLMDVEGYPTERIAALLQTAKSDVMRMGVRARLRLRAEIAALRQSGQCAA